MARSARDEGADHHERKHHEEHDQTQLRIVRHVLLSRQARPLLHCNHKLGSPRPRVMRITLFQSGFAGIRD
jgi:hypothetical protein